MLIRQLFKVCLLFLFTLQNYACYSQALKCFLYQIEGLEREHDLGVLYNGDNTKSLSDVKVYIVASDDKLYMQSNFLIYDDSEYPVKMVTEQSNLNTEDYLGNLLLTKKQMQNAANNPNLFLSTIHNLKLTIDPSVLKSEKFSHLDFSEFKNISFACPDNVARPAARLENSDGTFEYMITYNDNISLRINRNNLLFTFSRLRTPASFENMRIVSLIENSSTKDLLQQKFSDQILSFDYSGIKGFEDLLLTAKGEKIVLLGHIEDNSFITNNAAGEEIFRMPINEIQDFQRSQDLNLIILGCNAAKHGMAGPANKFNSIDVLNRLEVAKNSKNYEEFVNNISGDDLQFVLDETFFTDEAEKQALINGNLTMPSRLDFNVYGQNLCGKVTFLSAQAAIPSNSESTQNPEVKEKEESHVFRYIVIGLVVLMIIGYFSKSE